ncbi:MAG: hypothetical protein AB7S53_13070 [Thiomonas sp.]
MAWRCVEKAGNIGIFLRLSSLLRAISLQTSMVPVMGPDPREELSSEMAEISYFWTSVDALGKAYGAGDDIELAMQASEIKPNYYA